MENEKSNFRKFLEGYDIPNGFVAISFAIAWAAGFFYCKLA